MDDLLGRPFFTYLYVDQLKIKKMIEQPRGFKDLLNKMMRRKWLITSMVLGGFLFIIGGMFFAILNKNTIEGEWKELLLLLLGAFIGSYGKIIDYWFSDADKDELLIQKMDEEDGTTLSNVNHKKKSNKHISSTTPNTSQQLTVKN